MTKTFRNVCDFARTGTLEDCCLAARTGVPRRIAEDGAACGGTGMAEGGAGGTTMTCWHTGQLICVPE
jgi:hypothetical protein